jgi:predicted XRE-type DNA-binding protein
MSGDEIELARGSGNVFEDFCYPDATVRQAKAVMGAQIIKILDKEGLSTRQAEARTGVAYTEFSRIRRANFARFTIDRLITILHHLGQEVAVSVDVRPRRPPENLDTATMSP